MTEAEEKKVIDQEEEEVEEIKVEDLTPQRQLYYYSKTGDIEGVKRATKNGADVNANDLQGFKEGDYISQNTALHYACETGNVAMVDLLLSTLEASIDSKNKLESTPLHIAAAHGYTDVVKLLIKWKADLGAKNKIENTPLHCAVYGGHVEATKAILDEVDDKRAALQEPNGIGFGAYKYCAHDEMKVLLRKYFPRKGNAYEEDNKENDEEGN